MIPSKLVYFFHKDDNVSFGWGEEEVPTQTNEAFICTPPNENSTQTNLSPTVNSDETQTFDVKNEKDITHISETLFSDNYVYYTMY